MIRDRKLTIWNSVPSVIDLMIRAGHMTPEMLAPLRMITFCGEPLLEGHVEAIFKARPDVAVHNTYGPTEATVSCTLVKLTPDNFKQRCRPSVSLGVPIEGMRFSLDEAGELVIHGPQVALGYWRRPDLTQAAFVLADDAADRSYRTGDRAQLHEGEWYFLARADRQVKRGGYRIELGDVDAAVRAVVNAGVCTVFVDKRLITFVEAGADGDIPSDVLAQLATRIPPYMVPEQIRRIDRLPRSANDKIDVLSLEKLAQQKAT